MSSEAVRVALERDGASDAGSPEGLGSGQAEACTPMAPTSTVGNGTETAALTTQALVSVRLNEPPTVIAIRVVKGK